MQIDNNLFNSLDKYLERNDWREKENANQSFCFTSFLNSISGKILSNYGFEKIYNNDKKSELLVDYHTKGKVHIHDLGHSIVGYCSGWSLGNLLSTGIPSINNNIAADPAKHFRTAIDQITNFIMILSNEWSGAQAFSDVDIYLAPYIYTDFKNNIIEIKKQLKTILENSNLTNEEIEEKVNSLAKNQIEKEVRQSIQSLLFNLNYPSRYGNQPPFSNFSLALTTPSDMIDKPIMIANELLKDENDNILKYKDMSEWVNFFNKIFFEELNRGDAQGRIFTFPVVTINITNEFFNIDNNTKNAIIENIKKFGGPYMTNQINGVMSKEKKMSTSDTRSMCCRLMMDLDEMRTHTGGLFGNGESTGSLGVVSIAMPAIAYESNGDWESFYNILLDTMDISAYGLMKKRDFVMNMYNIGLMPYTKQYLKGKFESYFNTIGYVGLNEALEIMGIVGGISSEEGIEKAQEILDFMLTVTMKLQKQYGKLFNLEAVPAEGASFRMALAMKKHYPGIKLSGTDETPMISNSCHPSVETQGDLFWLIENQNKLQHYHSGGTMLHLYLGEELTDLENSVMENLIKKICTNTTIPYFSLTAVFSVCPVHGYISGKNEYCEQEHSKYDLQNYGIDINGEIKIPCEQYARIVGYYKSFNSYNKGKKDEFDRRNYIYGINENNNIQNNNNIL